jgi:hypothetical protein
MCLCGVQVVTDKPGEALTLWREVLKQRGLLGRLLGGGNPRDP